MLVSPHSGGLDSKEDERICEIFCDNLRAYLAGRPLANVVDPAWATDVDLFVSANDAKLVRDAGRDVFPAGAGPDTLSLIDLDERPPAGARRRCRCGTRSSGPPQAVALSPDGRLAAVAAPTTYDRGRRSRWSSTRCCRSSG